MNTKREETPTREMQPVPEPSERATYRMKCRNYDGYNGQCYQKSGTNGHCFWDYACDGVCRRMKKWDKENSHEGEKFKIREIM